jgi:phosphatidylserine/phosphatidylglycerophosphate/cardiolipin synthase-like enzyme
MRLIEEWLMVGSTNLDVRSMRLNFELNPLVGDRGTAAVPEGVLSDDMEHSRQIIAEGLCAALALATMERKHGPAAPTARLGRWSPALQKLYKPLRIVSSVFDLWIKV